MIGNGKQKVLLLGWDAADWKVINPLMDKGLMPNMKILVEKGSIANLKSQDPMYSPMLWTSIATGKRPYKHGVLGFMEVSPDQQKVRPVMSNSRNCRAIWNMLTLKGLKSHVVGWWPSHPAESINGTMISNIFQNHKGPIDDPWEMPKGTVYPNEESEHYSKYRVHPQELTGQHLLPFVPAAASIDQRKDKRLFGIAKITAHAASLHAAFTNIIRNKEWDFAALYLDAIDHYCHGFMKYHPPRRSHIPVPDYELYKDVVVSGYRYHDMMLGRIMELIDDDTILMLVSDHGFQPDHLRPKSIPKEPAGPAYEHNPLGIIACMGPGINHDFLAHGKSQLDITPTILHMLGLPVGEDMDGSVMTDLFTENKIVKYIPSWEDIAGPDGRNSNLTEDEEEKVASAALKQLEELGYIEKQSGNNEAKIERTRNECNFNLARSYIDGGKLIEAIPILEKLHKIDPDAVRYAFRLASCYQGLGKLKEARVLIHDLRDKESFSTINLDMIEGALLLGEKKPKEAISLFKKIASEVDEHIAKINFQIATAYMQLGRYDDAISSVKKEIEIDPDLSYAHGLLAKLYLLKKEYLNAIDSYLVAIGLDFNNFIYHAGLGKALYQEGKYHEASKALENSLKLNPENHAARDSLAKIYKNYLRDDVKYHWHKSIIDNRKRDVIYIVSGMPRSGTSMMMQMLKAGGMTIFTDGQREKDENNPKGYFEHEAVKNIAQNTRFLEGSIGKVVKIVSPLLQYLPPKYEYKIIFMERDFTEILSSQRSMLKRENKKTQEDLYPLKLSENYKKQIANIKRWVVKNPNISLLSIQHYEVLDAPFESSIKIKEFLQNNIKPESMASQVDLSLYRESKKTVQ